MLACGPSPGVSSIGTWRRESQAERSRLLMPAPSAAMANTSARNGDDSSRNSADTGSWASAAASAHWATTRSLMPASLSLDKRCGSSSKCCNFSWANIQAPRMQACAWRNNTASPSTKPTVQEATSSRSARRCCIAWGYASESNLPLNLHSVNPESSALWQRQPPPQLSNRVVASQRRRQP